MPFQESLLAPVLCIVKWMISKLLKDPTTLPSMIIAFMCSPDSKKKRKEKEKKRKA